MRSLAQLLLIVALAAPLALCVRRPRAVEPASAPRTAIALPLLRVGGGGLAAGLDVRLSRHSLVVRLWAERK